LLKTMEASRNVLFVFGNIFGQNSKEMGDWEILILDVKT
jgi:hypothetical protein